jgi:hypothetical protein
MVVKDFKKGKTFCIGTSSDSKWISNKNLRISRLRIRYNLIEFTSWNFQFE